MTILLSRHAHAGKRSEWVGDDRLRPLSERGLAQSIGIRDHFAELPIGRIVSSPYIRCIQTMEPIAELLGLSVEVRDELAEEADADAAYALLLELDAVDGLACSHGDMIPLMLRRLVAEGMDTDGPLVDQKGSTWVIDLRDGHPRHGRYVAPFA